LKDGRTLRCWLNQIDPLAGRYELVAAPGNTDEQIRKLTQ
jgi:hypothetical protein